MLYGPHFMDEGMTQRVVRKHFQQVWLPWGETSESRFAGCKARAFTSPPGLGPLWAMAVQCL
jgi:hypothetical protein